MRASLTTSILLASLAIAAIPLASGAQALGLGGQGGHAAAAGGDGGDGHGGDGHGGTPRRPMWRPPARCLPNFIASSAFMEDSLTGYRKTCVYVGIAKVTIIKDPDAPPPPIKIERRKLAPRPFPPVRDPRSGWTYFPQLDRNTGQMFVQIEDANGNDVHINGDVPLPGGGPLYPVR